MELKLVDATHLCGCGMGLQVRSCKPKLTGFGLNPCGSGYLIRSITTRCLLCGVVAAGAYMLSTIYVTPYPESLLI